MIENDPTWKDVQNIMTRFMLYSNFRQEQMIHVFGILIDYYEKNQRSMEQAIKDIQVRE